jgi:hypothetical protein
MGFHESQAKEHANTALIAQCLEKGNRFCTCHSITGRYILAEGQRFPLSPIQFFIYILKASPNEATAPTRAPSTHWMPVITQLWMNLN